MTTAGSIVVDLLMKTGSFETDTKRAEARMKAMAKEMEKAGKIVAGALGTAAIATTAWIKASINAADEAIKQAQSVGLLVEQYTALTYAGNLSGVAQQEMASALTQLSRRAKDAADGGKEAADTFDRLGISVTTPAGALKATDQLLAELAERFAAMPDSAEKTAFATRILGDSGARLIPLLNSGADGLRRMANEARDLGVVMDTETARAAEEFNDNLTRLAELAKGAGNALMREFLPVLNQMANRIKAATETFDSLKDFLSASLSAVPFADAAKGVEFYTREVATLGQELDRLKRSGGLIDSLRISGAQKELAQARELLEFYERAASLDRGLTFGQTDAETARLLRQAGAEPFTPRAKAPPRPPAGPRLTLDMEAPQLAQDMADALQTIAHTDAVQIQALTDQLDRLFDLRATGLFGPEIEQAINRVRDQLQALDPAAKQAADEAKRLQEILSNTHDGNLAAVLQDIELINAAIEAGKITAEQWAQAIMFATKTLRDMAPEPVKIDLRFKQMADNIQDALGNTLYQTLKADFDNILDLWGDLLYRMVAEAAAADLAFALGLGDKKATGDNVAALLGNLGSIFGLGPGRAGGGPVQRGTLHPVNEMGGPGELLNAGGRQYLLAGQNGTVTPLTASLPTYYNPSASVRVSIENRSGEPMRVESATASSDPMGTVVRVVISELRKDVASKGPFSRELAGTFGLNRATGAARRS